MRSALTGMTGSLFLFALLQGCASSTGAPDLTQKGNLSLSASGTGYWSVECTAQTRRDGARSQMRGRGSRDFERLFMRDVRSAQCRYETGAAPLILKQEAAGLTCPFGEFEAGICETVLPAGTSGTLEYSVSE